MEEFEFVVVGSGVGLNVLSTAINRGMECALVENTKIGGTCLTRGCIPSKILVYPADVIRNVEHAKKVGVQYSLDKIDWSLISDRMWEQIEEGKQIEKSLKTVPNLKLFKGVGEFTNDYEMKVISNMGSKELGHFKGKQFLLASGARTAIPPVKGLDTIDYITNESFFGEKFPKKPYNSLIIIGGGVFAVEFAHIFSAMGTEVTVIEMLPRLISTEEPEISEFLAIKKHLVYRRCKWKVSISSYGKLRG
ncbi:MAG: FAD-dependent oxidoreductase [Candidatus Lokiarchaeota archaeon]